MMNMGILSGKISIEELESEIDTVLRGSFYKIDMEKIKRYVKNKASKKEKKELMNILKRGLKEAIRGYRRWSKEDSDNRDKIYRQKRKEYKTKIKELKKYKRVEIEGVVIDFN